MIAFTVNKEKITSNSYRGLPLVPFEEIKDSHPPNQYQMFIPLSAKAVNSVREKKYFEAKSMG